MHGRMIYIKEMETYIYQNKKKKKLYKEFISLVFYFQKLIFTWCRYSASIMETNELNNTSFPFRFFGTGNFHFINNVIYTQALYINIYFYTNMFNYFLLKCYKILDWT